MSGAFVISLDFELMWGVRDKRSVASYGDAILGGREAIPRILDLFHSYGIRATWATVGLLFARSKEEMLAYAPKKQPGYDNPRLAPYAAIEHEIGENEKEDPYHFGRSLIDRICDTEGQEIASHTYSHFYTMEPGQCLEAFRADIAANISIARDNGIVVKSIVFPRNQMTPAHVEVCREAGLSTWRGNPKGFLYREQAGDAAPTLVRGLRLIDSALPLDGMHGHHLPSKNGNIPASRFFRQTGGFMTDWQLRRIKAEMKAAAKTGQLYQLWWHPHNFGRDVDGSLRNLEQILTFFQNFAAEFGMRSLNMFEADSI
jgi:hypothetical protein